MRFLLSEEFRRQQKKGQVTREKINFRNAGAMCPDFTSQLFWTAIGSIGAVLAVVTIWWQASLLRRQIRASVLIEYEKTWRSDHMVRLRSSWASNGKDLDQLERILEYLEEFAGLHDKAVLDDRLVWDSTLGWHAARYYFYNQDSIKELRNKWRDRSLFDNLEKQFWPRYLKQERKRRRVTEDKLEEELRATKQIFIDAERNLCKGQNVDSATPTVSR